MLMFRLGFGLVLPHRLLAWSRGSALKCQRPRRL